MDKKLDGKVAIVTGSGQGIGKAIALSFAREGALAVINDINDDTIKQTVEEIKNEGGLAFPFKANVAIRAEVENLCEAAVRQYGGIHILVNNAGTRRDSPFMEVSEDDWDVVLDVNLKSVLLCTQAAAKYMIKQHYGKIINISSVTALGGTRADQASYTVSKAGVIALTKVAALALSPHGINVNSIAPGVIATPAVYRRGEQAARQFLEDRRKSMMVGRIGRPEDVANVALFLASDASDYLTAQVIPCEGGRTNLMLW